MHPFGRTPGRTGMQQGAYAARLALEDAGLEWKDMQFGYGGSYSSGNADALGNELGLTGMPFTNILNACATGGSSLIAACQPFSGNAGSVTGPSEVPPSLVSCPTKRFAFSYMFVLPSTS